MATTYDEFLAAKRMLAPSAGKDVPDEAIHPRLFPFQRALTRWALRKGRAALFADCGLGKTCCQLEWARLTGKRALIVAPLSVARQTEAEAAKLGIPTRYVRSQEQADAGDEQVLITNYEMISHFKADRFGAVVLDESSILKGLDGKTRQLVTEMFRDTTWRLCCTATPAPNDHTEIGGTVEFLGIMTRPEMLAAFFVHDDKGYRLKGHGREPFYRWMSSWAMFLRKPSDLGFSDEGFILPPLNMHQHVVQSDIAPSQGKLFHYGLQGIGERSKVRKATISERCDAAAELVRETGGQWLIWVGLNDEGREMHRRLPGSLLMEGSDPAEKKLHDIHAFQDGGAGVLITKGKMAGFGLNFQNCHQMASVGIGDSWEIYYQETRRCWRFGQRNPVRHDIFVSDAETEILANVLRKERDAQEMAERLIANIAEWEREEIGAVTHADAYRAEMPMGLPNWLETVEIAA